MALLLSFRQNRALLSLGTRLTVVFGAATSPRNLDVAFGAAEDDT